MANGGTHYLSQFDAASDTDKFSLVRRWIDTEPLPFFKELREQRPILVTPMCTLVTRFDDVTEVLNLPRIFTVAPYLPKMGGGIYLMAHDDDALHTREKSLMQSLLNRDDLPHVRAMVGRTAKDILDNAAGGLDVVNAYCRMVPAALVQDYFGLTGVDRKDLIEWSYWNQYDTFHNQPFDLRSDAQVQAIKDRHDETGAKLSHYVTELVARRWLAVKALQAEDIALAPWHEARKLLGEATTTATDDMLTRMLRTAYPKTVEFEIKRLGVNAGGLLIGAVETTSQAVAQVIQYVLQRPDLLTSAVHAAGLEDPTDFDSLVWEALRFVPIAPYLFRQASTAYTIGQGTAYATTVEAGTYVLPVTQSAMFDPRAFENPDVFQARRNWYHYFHFGFGSHECLGRYIGMVMIPEMVRQIVLRKDIRPQGDIDYKSGPFPEHYTLAWNSL